MQGTKKGFTLIELLIVIGILGILAAVTVVVLNPAELLAQARDSNRISDLAAINSAIAFYLSDVSNPTWTTAWRNCTSGTTGPGSGVCSQNNNTGITGSGWVPVNFTAISTGTPLSRLPLDPSNAGTACTGQTPAVCMYVYAATNTVGSFELDANMESAKYRNGGPGDIESKDGGDDPNWYEVGSNLTLIP